MNHSYRLVWNDASQRYVAAPETARGRGKGRTVKTLAPAAALLGALLALPAWAQAPPVHTLPTGGRVVVGQAQIAQNGSQMNIQQSSQKAILQWQGFDIGSAASVRFQQPNASAVALNRVVAGDASQIHGQLSANGQVWLVNPNGVVFGQGSRVNVGGLVASTLDTSNDDFLAGKAQFTRAGAAQGGISNQGEITASGDGQGGGLVALLAPTVKNEGIIRAQLGNVVLAGGDRVGLQAGANGFLQVALEPSTVKTLIENKQLILADGGQVLMTGRAADALSAGVVANSGTVQARALAQKNGRILLLADMQHGEVQAAGTLQANFVETSAARVHIDSQLKVLTDGGHWLIDPVDITIDQNKATAIEAALAGGDVTVTTSNDGDNPWGANGAGADKGDIHVNADISYAKNKLTLNADNHLHINARIAVNGDGRLALNYGGTAGEPDAVPVPGSNLNVSGQVDFAQAGTDLLSVNGHGYTVINSLDGLQKMNDGLGGKYALGGSVDASATADWNDLQGFSPIGNGDTAFTGIFDGLGHTINGLTINRPDQNAVGLFGYARNATLRNVGLVGGSVEGKDHVGTLVGYNLGSDGTASITNAYAAGAVTGQKMVGGLVGSHGTKAGGEASISNAYATGPVTGASAVGGLVGFSVASEGGDTRITNVYATGPVTADAGAGGLVGVGMVGNEGGTVSISNAYATGKVTGVSNLGGLLGAEEGVAIERSFYATTDTAGAPINPSKDGGGFNAIGEGKTLAELKQQSTFEGWNIDDQGGTGLTWRIYEGSTTPLLRSFLKGVTVTATDIAGKTYDGSVASGSATYTTDVAGSALDGSLGYSTTDKNAGTYSIADGTLKVGGLFSGQQGYDIRYASSTQDLSLTIDRRAITLGANAASKTYGDADTSLGVRVTDGSLANGDSLAAVSGAVTRDGGENAGQYNLLLGAGEQAGNYSISFDAGNKAFTIDRRAITLAAVTDHKTYDGSTTSNAAVRIEGLVDGDRITGLGQSFDSRNAGSRGLQVNDGYAIEDGNGGGNYEISTRGAEGRIDPRALTIAANNAHKLSGQALDFSGTEFSTNDGGLVFGETVQSVTLASAGSAAHAGDGSYAIAASNAQGGNGFDAGNYDIRYVDGRLSVAPPVPQPVEPPVAPSVKPPVEPSAKPPFTSFAARPSLISLAGDAECTGPSVRQKLREAQECSLTAVHVPMLQVAPEFVRLR